MRAVKNMLWMASGVAAGFLGATYYKDIKGMLKKGKKGIAKTMNNM